MLCLTRYENQRIIIGEGPNAIVIEVIQIRGDKVRLGIEAPRNIRVHREEVANAISRKAARREGDGG